MTSRRGRRGANAACQRRAPATLQPVVAILAKAPVPGHAKTRLADAVGDQTAAAMYATVLRQFVSGLDPGVAMWRRLIFSARRRDMGWFERQYPGCEVRAQVPGDLGDRISAAFQSVFAEGHRWAVVTGSDSPELSPAHLRMARRLLSDHDVVLGPSFDGGYYLLAQRAPGADLFDGISWGTERAYADTVLRCRQLHLRIGRLPMLDDIDTFSDWLAWRRRQARGKGARALRDRYSPRTLRFSISLNQNQRNPFFGRS